MGNETQNSSASALADLVRLRNEGEITAEEFATLKQKLIYGDGPLKNGGETADPVGMSERQSSVFFLSLVIIAIAAIVYADNARGGIFPDAVYCIVGAGTSFQQAGRTEATSWSANNGCNASRPECATRWTSTPSSSGCSHGTMWEAIRAKFGGILGG